MLAAFHDLSRTVRIPGAMLGDPLNCSFPLDIEKLNRTEPEWWASVVAYLSFRAGCEWRLGKPRYRQSPEYLYYLRGLRLFHRLKNLVPEPCTCGICRAAEAKRNAARARLGALLDAQMADTPPPKKPAARAHADRKAATA